MKIKELFSEYEKLCSNNNNLDSIFEDSRMVNNFGRLDFGFFPIGSGIFSENSKIEIAEIEPSNVMVLGNDFGTENYINDKCENNRERESNPTIRNLLDINGLGLNRNNTFFTNYFMGLRKGNKMVGIKKLNVDYTNFCHGFFIKQLNFINPKIVICLGKEVQKVLKKKNLIFKDLETPFKALSIKDKEFGERIFISIPHPSFAHINWNRNEIIKLKKVIELFQ